MLYLASVLIAATMVVLAFFFPRAVWVAPVVIDAWFAYVLHGVRKISPLQEGMLSPRANELLRQYPHFYTMTLAGREFGQSAALFAFAGLVVAVIGGLRSTWWLLLPGIAHFLLMGTISSQFNPTNHYRDPSAIAAHDEIMMHMRNRARSASEALDTDAPATSGPVILKCESCDQALRVRTGLGSIRVTCPKCSAVQFVRT